MDCLWANDIRCILSLKSNITTWHNVKLTVTLRVNRPLRLMYLYPSEACLLNMNWGKRCDISECDLYSWSWPWQWSKTFDRKLRSQGTSHLVAPISLVLMAQTPFCSYSASTDGIRCLLLVFCNVFRGKLPSHILLVPVFLGTSRHWVLVLFPIS